MQNIDSSVVNDFGNEWSEYNQSKSDLNLEKAFEQYFSIFPKHVLHDQSVGFDAGCGSGRWAKYIAPKVKYLYCFDPSSKALDIAKQNLSQYKNCFFECSSINQVSITENSMDFGYCLGVLHHIPDTKRALSACVSKLKKGSPLLVYLYYRFDNKPIWFKFIWRLSDSLRKVISILPFSIKLFITKCIALVVYFPLARLSYLLAIFGLDVSNIPLSDYRNKAFYYMATDSLDRFGTRLEKRFTKKEIFSMMTDAGLTSITFSNRTPFWVAIGYKE